MVKSLKFKQHIREFGVSVLSGGAVLLGLLTIATSLHHFIMLVGILIAMGCTAYLLWRLTDG